jgi:hypothetical protein
MNKLALKLLLSAFILSQIVSFAARRMDLPAPAHRASSSPAPHAFSIGMAAIPAGTVHGPASGKTPFSAEPAPGADIHDAARQAADRMMATGDTAGYAAEVGKYGAAADFLSLNP